MKRSLALTAAVALLFAGASVLSAAEITGKIKSLSNEDDVIALEGGPTFYLAEGASLKGLAPGHTVTVTYDEQVDVKVATRITRTEPKQ